MARRYSNCVDNRQDAGCGSGRCRRAAGRLRSKKALRRDAGRSDRWRTVRHVPAAEAAKRSLPWRAGTVCAVIGAAAEGRATGMARDTGKGSRPGGGPGNREGSPPGGTLALPANLGRSLRHLDDEDLDRLLEAVAAEARRRGRPAGRQDVWSKGARQTCAGDGGTGKADPGRVGGRAEAGGDRPGVPPVAGPGRGRSGRRRAAPAVRFSAALAEAVDAGRRYERA